MTGADQDAEGTEKGFSQDKEGFPEEVLPGCPQEEGEAGLSQWSTWESGPLGHHALWQSEKLA